MNIYLYWSTTQNPNKPRTKLLFYQIRKPFCYLLLIISILWSLNSLCHLGCVLLKQTFLSENVCNDTYFDVYWCLTNIIFFFVGLSTLSSGNTLFSNRLSFGELSVVHSSVMLLSKCWDSRLRLFISKYISLFNSTFFLPKEDRLCGFCKWWDYFPEFPSWICFLLTIFY